MRTRARCWRNSALALWSLGGLVPSAACSAAVAGSAPDDSASSTPLARSAVGAHVREGDVGAAVHAAPRRRRRWPSPVRAESNFSYAQPPAPVFGTRISVSTSGGLERRLQEAGEALRDRQPPLAARTAHDQLGVERQQDRGRVGGRVAVGDRAADRPAVAHLRVADRAHRLGENRALGPQELVVVAGRGSE